MSSDIVQVSFEKCNPGAIVPQYAKDGDAGMDLCSCEDITIHPQQTVLVPVGLKVAIPYGYEIQIRPRSGISLNTMLRIPNAHGTIDCGYRNEINVIMHNSSIPSLSDSDEELTLSSKGSRHGTYVIHKGDRVAQMVLAKVSYVDWIEVDDVSSMGENRGGGFGSTGI